VINDLPAEATKEIFGGAIAIYNNIMTQEQAKKIINTYEEVSQDPDSQTTFVGAGVGAHNQDGGNVRSNLVMVIDPMPDNYEEWNQKLSDASGFVRERISACVRDYSQQFGIEIAYDEGLQLLKYGPGKQYRAHADQGPGMMYRVLSGVLYLNPTEYEGGSTYFLNYDVNVHPETISLALFPANYAYMHQAKPVMLGTKYAIVTWFGAPDIPGEFNG
jgi:hypothetical protein